MGIRMTHLLLRFTVALAALAAPLASATPQFRDGNDLWIAPDELGWGINVFHQGDTLFASIFVYGPDGRARWYTASSLQGGGGSPASGSLYTGPVFESTGPGIGTPFDPSRVTRRDVGSMSMEIKTGASGERFADVSVGIDGATLTRRVVPFSFVALGLTGSYTGYVANPSGNRDDFNANITLNGGSFAMSMTTSASGSCTYTGQQQAQGSLFNVRGSYSCSSNANSGSFALTDVDVTRHGFTAKVFMNGLPWTDIAAQRNSQSIRGDGYGTDLWLKAGESGWGLNIIEQGDTQFGTLFVYDAAGQPRWYSASNLTYELCAPPDSASDCHGRYRGALFESTGPGFGTAFNPAAVTRRQVGTMRIDYYGNDSANLEYTIDGVAVVKDSLRRFAFRANSLAGGYEGHMRTSDGGSDRGVLLGPMIINVGESGDSVVMTMRSSSTCTLRGTRAQYGRQVTLGGPYDCGAGVIGQMRLWDIYPTYDGFTASFELDGRPMGRISAVRTIPP
jgi:hypothetical protein